MVSWSAMQRLYDHIWSWKIWCTWHLYISRFLLIYIYYSHFLYYMCCHSIFNFFLHTFIFIFLIYFFLFSTLSFLCSFYIYQVLYRWLPLIIMPHYSPHVLALLFTATHSFSTILLFNLHNIVSINVLARRSLKLP